MNYYNENDPKAAAWLRELIKADLIAPGEVDERSIEDVEARGLIRFKQCHFFAGIGGWSYAFRLAGWDDERPVWTGSAPCQPFSIAGKRKGTQDKRHLWPAWLNLIRERRPVAIFGEQVSSPDGVIWLDTVHAGLETAGYRVGATVLPACSVGAPHKRERVWFVADANSHQPSTDKSRLDTGANGRRHTAGDCTVGVLGVCQDANGRRPSGTDNDRRGIAETGRSSAACGLGNASRQGCERREPKISDGTTWKERRSISESSEPSVPVNGFWRDAEWIPCKDGKSRPVEPGVAPLANGVPARVVRLRGYGNAIVPQVAVEFIKAYMDLTPERIE